MHYKIRLFELKALQSSERSLQRNGTKSTCAVTFRSEAIRQAVAHPPLYLRVAALCCSGIFTSSLLASLLHRSLSLSLSKPPNLRADACCREDRRPLL